MKFFITRTNDAKNNPVLNVCVRREGEEFHSVVAEVKEHNIAKEHGTAEQWVIAIGAALTANVDMLSVKVYSIT